MTNYKYIIFLLLLLLGETCTCTVTVTETVMVNESMKDVITHGAQTFLIYGLMFIVGVLVVRALWKWMVERF